MAAPAIPPSAPFRLTQPVADAATAAGVVFADGVARGGATSANAKGSAALGTDLFNPFDPDIAFGQYIVETTGLLTNGSGFNVTGFIPCKAGDVLVAPGPVMNGRRAYYSAPSRAAFVSGVNNGGPGSQTVPNDPAIAYVSFSVPPANWDTLKIENKTSQTVFTPYKRRSDNGDKMQLHMLRQTASRLTMMHPSLSYSLQFIINLPNTDSYFHGTARSTRDITTIMKAKFGDAGGGWCSFGFLAGTGNAAPWTVGNQPSFLNGNAQPTIYPTIIIGSGAASYYTEPTCDMSSYPLAVGEVLYQGFPATPVHNGCDLHYIGAAGASVNVAYGTYTSGPVNDPASYTFGSNTNYPTTNTVTTVLDIKAGIPSGAGMVRITGAGAAQKVAGLNLISAAKGVRVNKLSATGSNSGSWATVMATAGFATSFQALGGHLNIMMQGPNAQGGINYQQEANNNNTILSRLLALAPSADRLWLIPPENARTTNVYSIAGYENLARNVAVSQRCGFAVIRFGDAGNTAEYKSTGPVPLLNGDDLHPSDPGAGAPSGGAVITSAVLSLIVPRWA